MILERIVEVKKQEVLSLRTRFNLKEARSRIREMAPTKGLKRAIRNRTEPVALIAEVKQASPSKGVIRVNFDPVGIARDYERAGAHAISVVTDEPFFQGHGSYLSKIRTVVDLPLLRKDFIIDELQIYESRILGADAILLIAGILSKEQLKEYSNLAASLGLDSLVEVHNEAELELALDSEAAFIGINNRNLKTFEVSLTVTEQLAKLLPSGTLFVSESGIFTPEDIHYVHSVGASAVLVGESLMRQQNLVEAVETLMGKGSPQ